MIFLTTTSIPGEDLVSSLRAHIATEQCIDTTATPYPGISSSSTIDQSILRLSQPAYIPVIDAHMLPCTLRVRGVRDIVGIADPLSGIRPDKADCIKCRARRGDVLPGLHDQADTETERHTSSVYCWHRADGSVCWPKLLPRCESCCDAVSHFCYILSTTNNDSRTSSAYVLYHRSRSDHSTPVSLPTSISTL